MPCFDFCCGGCLGAVVGAVAALAGGSTEKGMKKLQKLRGGKRPAQSVPKTGRELAEGDLDWLNKMVIELWPRINTYVDDLVHNNIEPTVNSKLPLGIATVKFGTVTLGDVAPKFGPLVLREPTEGALAIDIGLDLSTTLELKITAAGVPIGVQKLMFQGVISVILRPPANKPPFFGAVEVFFANPPQLDLDFTGVANLADCPGIRGIVRGAVQNAIGNMLVIPARMAIDMIDDDDLDATDIRYQDPYSLMQVTLHSGSGLRASDSGIFGGEAKTSDPYVTIEMGQHLWTSAIKSKTLEPKWTEQNITEFLVYSNRQCVNFVVWDNDTLRPDDLLGSASVPVKDLKTSADRAVPLTYEEAPAGSITVSTKWCPIQKVHPAKLAPGNSQLVLVVKIEDVTGLPRSSKAPFLVHVKALDKTTVTNASKAPTRKAATPLAKELAKICHKLADQHAMPTARISELVSLSEEEVESAIKEDKESGSKEMAKATAELAASHPVFDEVVYLILPWGESTKTASVSLTLTDKRKKQVGSPVEVKLEDVVSKEGAEYMGPAEEGKYQVAEGAWLKARFRVLWVADE